jgi:hypothetical protein
MDNLLHAWLLRFSWLLVVASAGCTASQVGGESATREYICRGGKTAGSLMGLLFPFGRVLSKRHELVCNM